MRIKIYILFMPLLLLSGLSAWSQIIRPFTPRYSNPSVRGNIVYVANSIISTTGIGAGNPGTGEPPPGGTTRNNGAAAINIDVDNPAPTVKLPFNSVWNYHTQNAAPVNSPAPTDWKQPAYVMPAAWNVGAVPVAGGGKYGFNSGQATCLKSSAAATSCTPGAVVKYTAYYFTNTVNFTAAELATTFQTIQLNVQRNDGIVIYINGVERARDNMPAGVPAFGTLASADITVGANENFTFNLSPTFFAAGANTIAVEVHLRTNTSTNMSFDMQVLGLDNNGTTNSSTADLNLTSCSNILFAGLYWGAGQGNSGSNKAWITGETSCKFKLPGAATYTNITSTQTDYWDNVLIAGYAHTGYQCFADVTTMVQGLASPNGTYTLGNIASPLGLIDAYGGWTMVVVYGNPSLLPRNLNVFDGCAAVKSGSPNVDVNITGFLTPPAGPVSCELGAVVYDGDRSSTDAYSFRQNGAAVFYDLTPTANNPTSNLNDMWNSVIGYKGVVVTTRNPAFQNTLGYDANIINLPNAANAQLGNSKTSATVRFSSPSENYLVHVVSTSISQYNPTFAFDKTATDINGGSLLPGDNLRYQVNYTNVGNDASTNTIITDNIPAGTAFVPGSIKINGVAKTDAAGDDQAEYDFATNRVIFRLGTGANAVTGGVIPVNGTGNVQFDVTTPSSCTVASCTGPIQNNARISYVGQLSSDVLYDSSGVNTSGCIVKGPVISNLSGSCYNPVDTILNNICPSLTKTLPYARYAGYTFYSALPFIPANIYNPYTVVTSTHTYFAYYNTGSGCIDTIKINVFISGCPDIDDDRDGIPDYVEINLPAALGDHDADGIPNWMDTNYPGFVDNNLDGFNDNFDPGADSDNDGIPNYYDTNFPGYVDTNGDGVNDNMDNDKDGIPNYLDRDSDNDGIPDVVESLGVDTNGDGRIDNFSDSDNDGLSQNVDASNTGISGSGNGLGTTDTDGDGVPNYFDLDSDNDGIPDVIEVYGTDANNDGGLDNYTDTDGDGYSDNIDGDVDNDGVAENAANTLLRTGNDTDGDGRANSYPYKNMDNDSKTNPYDLDSDSDGITDTREAGFADTDYNGRVDGTFNANGWSTVVAALPSLNMPNTDATGRANPYDIDSDNDGIPDNIEGQPTSGYFLPSGIDTDLDGIDNTYDNFAGFGGDGIHIFDMDGDTIPDYRDTDTDGDGLLDIVEGNDFNLNGSPDDNVTLTGIDTDGDGLDDRFDNNNSSVEGTSLRMGNGGSTSGDVSPGSITTVQHTAVNAYGCPTERDWRCNGYVLHCDVITFKGVLQDKQTLLDWTVLCQQDVEHFIIERSSDGISFSNISLINSRSVINESESYHTTDDVSNIHSEIIYYRLRTVLKDGKTSFSNIITILRGNVKNSVVLIFPNPVKDQLQVSINTEASYTANIYIVNVNGKTIKEFTEKIRSGSNTFMYSETSSLPNGVYYLLVNYDDKIISRKFNILK